VHDSSGSEETGGDQHALAALFGCAESPGVIGFLKARGCAKSGWDIKWTGDGPATATPDVGLCIETVGLDPAAVHMGNIG